MNRRWLVLFLAFTFCLFTYSAEAAFFDRNNCDEIPSDQRVAEGTMCLQRTTAGGRPPATYVWNGTIWRQDSNVPRVTIATRPTSPRTGDVVVVTDAASSATCTTGGGVASSLCQWDGSTWVTIGGGGAGGGGHAIHDEGGASLTQRSDINCVGAGVTCADVGGMTELNVPGAHTIQDEGISVPQRQIINVTGAGATVTDAGGITVLNVPGGAGTTFTTVGTGVNTSSVMTCGTGCQVLTSGTGTITPNYTPSGTIAATTVQGAIAELDSETQTALAGKQPVDADLTALAANSTAGFWATPTNIARSMVTANSANISITNPAGILGSPTWDVGPNVALTTRGFTPGAFDFDFGSASSFAPARSAGANPTSNFRIAGNISTSRLVYGVGGTTYVVAHTGEIQPLTNNGTAFAALIGANGKIPYFTGPGTMGLTSGLETPCAATGTQALTSPSVGTFACSPINTGFTGGTAGTIPIYLTATTAGPSHISESGGNVIIDGNLVVGTGADSMDLDSSAYATHGHVSVAVPYVGAGASLVLSTGAKTNGHVVKWNAVGAAIDGGIAGVGDVTLAGPNTMHLTTLLATGVGSGDNTITLPLVVSFDGAGLTPSSGCSQDPSKVQINSGPYQYVLVCPTAATAQFGMFIPGIKQAVTTLQVRLKVNDVDSSAQHFAGTFKAQCRASGTSPSSTWGTTQTVNITMTTANVTYEGLTAAITPNGTCSANADLYIQFDADGNMTDDGDARIIGAQVAQAS